MCASSGRGLEDSMIFPIGDQNEPGGRRAPVTLLIILANFAVFLLLQLPESGKERQPITYGYSTIPYEITHNVDLVGPKEITVGGERGLIDEEPGPRPIWLTIFTSMFLHGGWLHILGNMWFLWIFGDNVERRLGSPMYVVLYLGAGVVAGIAQILPNPDSFIPSLGASGAIAGVPGARRRVHRRSGGRLDLPEPATSAHAAIRLRALSRAPHLRDQRPKSRDIPAVQAQGIHQGGGHDDAVGARAHERANVLWAADTEADGDRHRRNRTDLTDQPADRPRK